MLERVVDRAYLDASKVVRDVDGPGRPSNGGERPQGQETVDTEDDEVDVLDPLVEEDLAQLHHLKLAPDRYLEGRVSLVAGIQGGFLITVEDVSPLCLVEVFQSLQCQHNNRTTITSGSPLKFDYLKFNQK